MGGSQINGKLSTTKKSIQIFDILGLEIRPISVNRKPVIGVFYSLLWNLEVLLLPKSTPGQDSDQQSRHESTVLNRPATWGYYSV